MGSFGGILVSLLLPLRGLLNPPRTKVAACLSYAWCVEAARPWTLVGLRVPPEEVKMTIILPASRHNLILLTSSLYFFVNYYVREEVMRLWENYLYLLLEVPASKW